METLQGTIVYRLNLPQISSDVSKKRKRTSTAAGNNVEDDASCSKRLFQLDSDISYQEGFFFIPSENASLCSPSEYMLSVPLEFLTTVCDAARYNYAVRISNYSVQHHKGQTKNTCELLILHRGGFSILRRNPSERSEVNGTRMDFDPNTGRLDSRHHDDENTWTLPQFARQELVNQQASDQTTSILQSQQMYTLHGMIVDAISPIVAVDPKSPFAILELYDSEQTQYTSVVVLTGTSVLQCHAGIVPGQRLVLRVQRKAWSVPKVVERARPPLVHLQQRVPNFVFIVKKAHDIHWQQSAASSKQDAMVKGDTASLLPAMAVPLVAMDGTIRKVQMGCTKEHQRRCILWVELSSTTMGDCRLMLSQFPMSVALQCSFQVGHVIRAMNVHKIATATRTVLAACLRSTVLLVDSKDLFEKDRCSNQTKENMELDIQQCIPFHFGKFDRSYAEELQWEQIETWRRTSFHTLQHRKDFPHMVDFVKRSMTPVSLQSDDSSLPTTYESEPEASQQRKKAKGRNPYFEFFDHAYGVECNVHPSCSSGCSASVTKRRKRYVSRWVGVRWIKEKTLHILSDKLPSIHTQSGWNGSMHFSTIDLVESADELRGTHRSSHVHAFTGGYVSSLDASHQEAASVYDDLGLLNVHMSATETKPWKGSFLVGKIKEVVVSCYCLMHEREYCDEESAGKVVHHLPLPHHSPADAMSQFGSCEVLRSGGRVFLVSLSLRLELPQIHKQALTEEATNNSRTKKYDSLSIEQALTSPTICARNDIGRVRGLLVRRRFRFARHSDGYSNGLVLTLSQAPEQLQTLRSDVCTLQSMDIKVALPYNPHKAKILVKTVLSMFPSNCRTTEDEIRLGVCWWSIADSNQSLLLSSGGVDDHQGRGKIPSALLVEFPAKALTVADRGYVRAASRLHEVCFTGLDIGVGTSIVEASPNVFDFIQQAKVMESTNLSRRSKRLVLSREKATGEYRIVVSEGIPDTHLGHVYKTLCASLRDRNSGHLSPSLVHRVRGCKLLGCSFVQVQATCSKCFAPLVKAKTNTKSAVYVENNEERSFWHLPPPDGFPLMSCKDPSSSATRAQSNRMLPQLPAYILRSGFRCSAGCPEEFLTVKWECSGILDDGKGQGKVYADRDVALMLLGMTVDTIHLIERGVWATPKGILQFSKGIPPSSQLRNRLRSLVASTQQTTMVYDGSQRPRGSRASPKKTDPTAALPADLRAEYLLQYHCRHSSRPRRPLDYFVRVKPLSDSIANLNHTMIDSYSRVTPYKVNCAAGEAATYSLPPLKLHLVDCCVATKHVSDLQPSIYF